MDNKVFEFDRIESGPKGEFVCCEDIDNFTLTLFRTKISLNGYHLFLSDHQNEITLFAYTKWNTPMGNLQRLSIDKRLYDKNESKQSYLSDDAVDNDKIYMTTLYLELYKPKVPEQLINKTYELLVLLHNNKEPITLKSVKEYNHA